MMIPKNPLRLLLGLLFCYSGLLANSTTSPLRVIEQDYVLAKAEAAANDKLLFIDFYTTWCAPCKQLDKLVFHNDSIGELLAADVILLRYDAENDTVFHLSKKHHVSSYPTGLILNAAGRVINRQYGFMGEDAPTLQRSVLSFVRESRALNEAGEYLSGYGATIDPAIYPDFYTAFVNRTDTDLDAVELNEYFSASADLTAEQYFSPLLYFAGEVSDSIADAVLERKEEYVARYGETDVTTMTYFFVNGRFRRAMKQQDPVYYDRAVAFAKKHLSQEWLENVLPSFEKDYLMAQHKWAEVLAINQELKNAGELSNGYLNHFSWQVYKECDDEEVVRRCVEWMKQVTEEEPTFDYLDTYAYLLHKSGDAAAASSVARRAIEVGKTEDRRVTGLEKLVDSIEMKRD